MPLSLRYNYTFNRIQWYAREAAVQVGLENFDAAHHALQVLDKELENDHTFLLRATMVNRDHDGSVVEFKKEDLGQTLESTQENELYEAM